MAKAFKILSSLLFAAVVVQFALAGYGVFYAEHKAEHTPVTQSAFDHGFKAHVVVGTVVLVVMLLLVVVALAGRLGGTPTKFAVALLVAGLLQFALSPLGKSVPALGFLHVLNGLAIYAAAGLLAHRSWTTKPALPSAAA